MQEILSKCKHCNKEFKSLKKAKRKFCSRKCYRLGLVGIKRPEVSGENNYRWGKRESNEASCIHDYMRRRIAKPRHCVICHINSPKDLANMGHKYNVDNTKEWLWLCRKCHNKLDGRDKNLIPGPHVSVPRDSITGKFLKISYAEGYAKR